MDEKEKVIQYIHNNPNYKIADIQRLLQKGYIYCYKLLERIGEK